MGAAAGRGPVQPRGRAGSGMWLIRERFRHRLCRRERQQHKEAVQRRRGAMVDQRYRFLPPGPRSRQRREQHFCMWLVHRHRQHGRHVADVGRRCRCPSCEAQCRHGRRAMGAAPRRHRRGHGFGRVRRAGWSQPLRLRRADCVLRGAPWWHRHGWKHHQRLCDLAQAECLERRGRLGGRERGWGRRDLQQHVRRPAIGRRLQQRRVLGRRHVGCLGTERWERLWVCGSMGCGWCGAVGVAAQRRRPLRCCPGGSRHGRRHVLKRPRFHEHTRRNHAGEQRR